MNIVTAEIENISYRLWSMVCFHQLVLYTFTHLSVIIGANSSGDICPGALEGTGAKVQFHLSTFGLLGETAQFNAMI